VDPSTADPSTGGYHFFLIDLYRPRVLEDDPSSAGHVAAIQQVADRYDRAPFPVNNLFELGVACAFRNKVFSNMRLRLFAWAVLNYVLREENPKRLVCSEFVYRCFSEAWCAPPGALKLTMVVPPPRPQAFPNVDWLKLLQEYEEASGKALVTLASVTEEQFELLRAEVRARLTGPQEYAWPLDVPSGTVITNPPPRSIQPSDLANSPSVECQGRLFEIP
jgi:hypothetical protein